ncbi:PAS domain S-box protein [Massilia sp. W12]|uniref:sensor histidine kinase n=1 Tax=Massilia sp. W12 TaxID=3126507 RepID=UPI0030CE2E2C
MKTLLPSFLRRNSWRWMLPVVLVLSVLGIIVWLPWQLRQLETVERQEQLVADTLWVEQSLQFQLLKNEGSMRLLAGEISSGALPLNNQAALGQRLYELQHRVYEFEQVQWWGADGMRLSTNEQISPWSSDAQRVALEARRTTVARFAPPHPALKSESQMLVEFFLPVYDGTTWLGHLVAIYDLNKLLEVTTPWWFAQENQISLYDQHNTLLAQRAALGSGRGIYTHQREVELPGLNLRLHTNSLRAAPSLAPRFLVGSVIVLALGLIFSLWLLWRHVERRLAAESALRAQMAFRTAMENSLVTGMRARDLDGRVTYVNPAFCQIVGYAEHELIGKLPPMPYWAPEAMQDYQDRFAQVLAGTITPQGFETIFQRADGARVPVLVFESPLLDASGKQTGWMGSILDISERKQIEELNRQQQEKLQTSARLATMGELASILAHELNQPLAAISSYATGALNILQQGHLHDLDLLKEALEKARQQAQRAGQIIRSVHEFVKKREPARHPVGVQSLLDTILPLIELQAQRYFVKVQCRIPGDLPLLHADKTMLEQVLLNLTRNAIEAMREAPPERRILVIQAQLLADALPPQISVAVCDYGHGITPEVAERLFSPFFSTKAEGMGMGLNICRTAIEFHGGALEYLPNPEGGAIFRFSLPLATQTG